MTDAPRYFYDCPIKAAFMSKYHGMKIHAPVLKAHGEVGESDRPLPDFVWARKIEHVLKTGATEQYRISDESIFLLDPIINDVIWTVKDGFYDVQRICDVYDKPQNSTWRLHRIIERNGCCFFWPEREDA
jgi:hypothetical protein